MDYSENIGLVLFVVIVLGALVMGGLAYFAYWLLFKKASSKQKDEEK